MEPVILSHASALDALRHARRTIPHLGECVLERSEQQRVLENATCAAGHIDFEQLEFMHAWAEGAPLDVLVQTSRSHSSSKTVLTHALSKLPSNSLIALSHGLYCVSPPLLVAEYAESRIWQEVLALCYELCGSFSLVDDDDYFSTEGYCACAPIVSAAQLRRYLSYATEVHGLPCARKAAKLTLDDAASPMEAIVAGVFHAPMNMGGFGIQELKLNYRMELTREASIISSMPYVVLDAYVPAAKATLEYNGHHHDSRESRLHDEKRAAGLEAMGITTIPINYEQLRDIEALEAIAQTLYRLMGKQFRYRVKSYRPKQQQLLNSLRISMGLKAC